MYVDKAYHRFQPQMAVGWFEAFHGVLSVVTTRSAYELCCRPTDALFESQSCLEQGFMACPPQLRGALLLLVVVESLWLMTFACRLSACPIKPV